MAQLTTVLVVLGYLVTEMSRAVASFQLEGAGGGSALPRLGVEVLAAVGIVLTVSGIVRCAFTLARQCMGMVTLSRWVAVHRVEPDPQLLRAGDGVLPTDRIVQVDSRGAFALTYGLLRPRVLLSSGFVAVATEAELAVVLRHEWHHAERLDPLNRLVLGLFSALVWYVPGSRRMLRHHLLCQELAADRAALSRSRRQVLAGALLKVASAPRFNAAVAGMHTAEIFEARVRQLEGRVSHQEGRQTVYRHVPCALLIAAGLAGDVAVATLIEQFCRQPGGW
ncbi:M56 family metallopeptidase [Micromonospora sp. STR1_7]|uniref:M56 family metallopeptidase n=1 Tax=Micromonospora parastrephiae TaxID=2806101 RepID=A0ABS1XTI7_9ACTN|nr:M56 family metallopeptidase [Micromonospora parastrephiae]MBM0232583.1 M56 family metallopeptidase [Micromonospora parastrephiae]